MREIIDKPNYRALKSIGERKLAFQDFVDDKRRALKEAKKSKLERDKRNLCSLFDKNPLVYPASRWNKVKSILSNEPSFLRSLENTRHSIFEEWSRDKTSKLNESSRALKKDNMEKFRLLLQTVEITIESTWKGVQDIYKNKHGYKEDKNLQAMDITDCLYIYENKMKKVEDSFFEGFERKRNTRLRKERKNRDVFKALLNDMKASKEIIYSTRWCEVYSIIKNNAAYKNMLGQSGSTPLDLFMDLIVDLSDKFESDKKQVQDAIKVIYLTTLLI